MIKKIIKYFTPFQWAEVLAVTGFTVYFAITDEIGLTLYNILSAFAAICGINCVVLCAAGKKAQYYWGFVNIAAYVAVSWISRFYGEVMLNALYYLPSQFVGIYMWKKNMEKDSGDTVKGRRMKPLPAVLLLIGTAVAIVLYKLPFVGSGRKLRMARQRKHGDIHYRKPAYDNALP